MAANLSSSSSDSLAQHHPLFLTLDMKCLFSTPSFLIFTAYNITLILLLLPLCVFILGHGLRQWRPNCSAPSASAAISHSDSFTYHMVLMELVGIFGGVLCCCGMYWENMNVFTLGRPLLSFNWFGENSFHVLTCVERYLAVVHPITYLSLKQERGVRIRNAVIGCAWLFCAVGTSSIWFHAYAIISICSIISSLLTISFCSLSVLGVLIRPGPGKQEGGRERVDQTKQRAFNTIVAILGVLLLRATGDLFWGVQMVSGVTTDCMTLVGSYWLLLPSSLVLPLLFLHRAGKFVCCQKTSNDG